jgi:hypothetical protein
VDKRYWWNHDHCGDLSAQDVSSWGALFNVLRDRMGLTADSFECPAIHADWLQPHEDLQEVNALPLGMMLDAAAWNVGRKVSFDYERLTLAHPPVVRVREYDWHEARRQANLTNTAWFRLAGGDFEMGSRGLSPLLPEKVVMTFSDDEDVRKSSTFLVSSIAEYVDHAGIGEVVFHNRLEYQESTNDQRLLLLERMAKAYIGFQVSAANDVVYNSHVKWVPEGLNDIEWHELAEEKKELVADPKDGKLRQRVRADGMARTRLTRGPLNLVAQDLWHGSNASASGSRSSGQTYTITCADGSSQTVTVRRS